MAINVQKAPFPWFGGKSKAAPVVWAALGNVNHYIEPFAGSLAVLLNRPHLINQTQQSETVNDLDGLLVNAWRSIQWHPDATAEAASWPVSEADIHARHLALVRWRAEHQLEHLMGDPRWCDPVMAGWWIWGVCCWIGSGWCAGTGAWTADDSGRLVKQGRNGVARQLPELAGDGRGVNHAGLRERGVESHELTMPELRKWFAWLSARLRHVRIANGDWRRTVSEAVSKTLAVRFNGGFAGVFLDPPYANSAGRTSNLYATDSLSVAHDVRDWCLANGDDPDLRIVLAGFEGEHGTALTDAGWREVEWFHSHFLSGGLGNIAKGGHQMARERLWLSPHCLSLNPTVADDGQLSLFD